MSESYTRCTCASWMRDQILLNNRVFQDYTCTLCLLMLLHKGLKVEWLWSSLNSLLPPMAVRRNLPPGQHTTLLRDFKTIYVIRFVKKYLSWQREREKRKITGDPPVLQDEALHANHHTLWQTPNFKCLNPALLWVTDHQGWTQCLFCLGECCIPDRCSVCKSFSSRDTQLKLYLLEQSMTVTLDPEMKITIRARPNEPALARAPLSPNHNPGSSTGEKIKRAPR